MALIRIPSGLGVTPAVSFPQATSTLGTVSPASIAPSFSDYTGGIGQNTQIGSYSISAPYSGVGGLAEVTTPVSVGPSFQNVPITSETGLGSALGGGGYSTGVTDPSTYGGQYGGGGISVVPVNTEQYGPAIPEGFSSASQAPTLSPTSQTYASPYPSGYMPPLDTYGNSPYNPQSAADIQTSYAANTANVATTPDFAGGPDYGPDVPSTTTDIPTDTFTSPDTGFTPGGGIPGVDASQGASAFTSGISPDIGASGDTALSPGQISDLGSSSKAINFFKWVGDWIGKSLVVVIGLVVLVAGLWLLAGRGSPKQTIQQVTRAAGGSRKELAGAAARALI